MERDFRINWDGKAFLNNAEVHGDIYAQNGELWNLEIKDTLTGGTIWGSDIYARYFEGNAGLIGGWTLATNGLYGGNTILNPITGIQTNGITLIGRTTDWPKYDTYADGDISTIVESNWTVLGTLGYGIGSDTTSNTNLFLIQAKKGCSMALETEGGGNIRIDAGSRGVSSENSPQGSIFIGPPSGTGYIKFQNIPPENQEGIYARFA